MRVGACAIVLAGVHGQADQGMEQIRNIDHEIVIWLNRVQNAYGPVAER